MKITFKITFFVNSFSVELRGLHQNHVLSLDVGGLKRQRGFRGRSREADVGSSKKLQSFEYGRCELCKADNECELPGQYPALCVEGQLQCKACHRAGRVCEAQLVDVFTTKHRS